MQSQKREAFQNFWDAEVKIPHLEKQHVTVSYKDQ
jgi:hypothetical protein